MKLKPILLNANSLYQDYNFMSISQYLFYIQNFIYQLAILFFQQQIFTHLIKRQLSLNLNPIKMHYQEQQQLPPLIPIKKKRQVQSSYTPLPDEKSKHLQSTQPKTQERPNLDFTQQSKITEPNLNSRNNLMTQKQIPKTPSDGREKKMQSFSQKFKLAQQKTTNQKKSTTKQSQLQKKEQNQKSKFLIAQMLNKISVKNISEQLYPITNQTIQSVIYQMQEQIKSYKTQAQKKQNTLITNPNNQHLKAQIANLEKSIDHCTTIKELYNQKINFRNKISILEGKIIQLRAQNRDLKIKVSRGIQSIQNHMHNLPCQKQKQLKQQLNKISEEYRKQKQMRMNLQNNIQDIIMNFKRLYEEADTARMIVTKKLREIQDRQKKLNQAKFQQINQTDQQNSNSKNRSPKLQHLDDKKSPKPGMNNPHESQNSTQRYRHSRPEKDQREREGYTRDRTQRQFRQTQRQSNLTSKRKQQPQPLSFQESIRKMRGNQNMFSKIYSK